MLQYVNVDNVDEPVVNVELTHFDKVELYCKTWFFDTLDNVTSPKIAQRSSSVNLTYCVPFHFKLWFTDRDDKVTSLKFNSIPIVLYIWYTHIYKVLM